MHTTSPRKGMPPSTSPDVEELTPQGCWDRLAATAMGRLAISTADGVEIFPVNYLVRDREILLRSGPGAKMLHLGERPDVAFEIDGRGRGHAWSVVVHGRAERLNLDADIESSGVRELRAAHPGAKYNYVRIMPVDVTGRRFAAFTGFGRAVVVAGVVAAAVVALAVLSIAMSR
jgi:nitroimidazol reductase NimA-like FMN-containing flavoprotein (pyridoxamine 5'-phosphate oxidase superfamily)